MSAPSNPSDVTDVTDDPRTPARRAMDEQRAQLALVRRIAWNYVGDRELDELLAKALDRMDAYTSRWSGGTA